jgi:hypothetical protein
MLDFDKLRIEITRDNALELLARVPCANCQMLGNYVLFNEINNNGVGIRCCECEKYHPFVKHKIMWLRGCEKRRSNDIVAVARECGAYCYGCGYTFEELEQLGVGLAVHHTREFAQHGENYKKIPVCAECHELLNFMQRLRKRQRALLGK